MKEDFKKLFRQLYMTMLKQMDGCFGLIGKNSKKPLYKEQKLYLEEMHIVEKMLMNQSNGH